MAEIWSKHDIDGYPVFAEYIEPENSEVSKADLVTMDEEWKATHVRSSQYFLQIVRCHQEECCGPFRSRLGTFFPNRFMPPPVAIEYNPQMNISKDCTAVSNPDNHTRFATLFQNITLIESWDVAYDFFCPSVKDKLDSRICQECNMYFASITMLRNHRKIHSVKFSVRRKSQKTS